MNTRKFTFLLLAAATVTVLANQTFASPTQMVHQDTPGCDFLFIPDDVEEIGDFIEFPMDESLGHMDFGTTSFVPCPANNQNLSEVVVEIRNTSGRDWAEVWYVADSGTIISNYDGEANQFSFSPIQEAFRIDNDISDPGGTHHPLISENLTADGIWEDGESWQFVLQDYFNFLGLPPDAISSIGVGNASTSPGTGIIESSGSIIAIPVVPEPATGVLMVIGLLAIALRRK